VVIGKTKPYPNGYLAFAHNQQSGEGWTTVSDEPTNLQTSAQYRLGKAVNQVKFFCSLPGCLNGCGDRLMQGLPFFKT
jgi:hypothetical protein